MIKKLGARPRHWLTLDVCSHLYKSFRKKLEINEPIPLFETRFQGKLEGILSSVPQTFDRKLLNPIILDATAAYLNQIIRGHPFQNGNKRMAVLYAHSFLLLHGVDFSLRYNELFHVAAEVAIASSYGVTSEETKQWCKEVIAAFTKDKRS